MSLEADETLDVLDRLNQLYIGARYPGERGLLPEGQPSQEEARQFHRVATQFYERIHQRLKDE